MIARLSGTVWSIGDNYAVIRTGGIGLQVHTPTSVLRQLDGAGQPVDLFTHLHVRENELTLYGFLTEDELALFRLLLRFQCSLQVEVDAAYEIMVTSCDEGWMEGRNDPPVLPAVPRAMEVFNLASLARDVQDRSRGSHS